MDAVSIKTRSWRILCIVLSLTGVVPSKALEVLHVKQKVTVISDKPLQDLALLIWSPDELWIPDMTDST